VPLKIRAPSNALSTSGNWIWNFMVVMITPIAFAKIGYQTYIIFAVINAFIVPCVYFFYVSLPSLTRPDQQLILHSQPETAYRSLEEMDDIFRASNGWFNVVKIAKPSVTPNRYDKHGQLLVNYLESDEHRRPSSSTEPGAGEKNVVRNKPRAAHNEGYKIEGGFGDGESSRL
jgi:hypothetical protein